MSIWIQTMAALVLSGSLVYGQGAGENPPAASPASNVSGAPIEAGEPVDTIPGLRALATPEKPSQLVRWVKGYHAIGDGGGGNYVYNAHSSTPDNGGVVIAPNSGKGRWLLEFSGTVNVRQFGAFGDGRHDDTKAIRDAIDSLLETSTPRDYGAEHRDGPVGRGSVYIPPGIYVCQNVLLRSGICIRGAGEQVTTLLLKGGTQYLTDPKDPTSATPGNLFCTVLSYDGSYSDYTFGRQTWTDGAFARSKKWESSRRIVRDVTIADLTIDGNKAENLVGDGTDRYPKNGTVMAAGVNLMFADNVRLDRVEARDFRLDGFYVGYVNVGPSTNCHFSECRTDRNQRTCSVIECGQNNSFVDCDFATDPHFDIEPDASGTIVANNSIRHCALSALDLVAVTGRTPLCWGNTITDNFFRYVPGMAASALSITVVGADGSIFANNFISGYPDAITLLGYQEGLVRRPLLAGNIIRHCITAFYSPPSNYVSGVDIIDNSVEGVESVVQFQYVGPINFSGNKCSEIGNFSGTGACVTFYVGHNSKKDLYPQGQSIWKDNEFVTNAAQTRVAALVNIIAGSDYVSGDLLAAPIFKGNRFSCTMAPSSVGINLGRAAIFDDNRFVFNGPTAVPLIAYEAGSDGKTNTSIRNNQAQGWRQMFIFPRPANPPIQLTIEHNTFERFTDYGVNLEEPLRCEIAYNTVTDCRRPIYLNYEGAAPDAARLGQNIIAFNLIRTNVPGGDLYPLGIRNRNLRQKFAGPDQVFDNLAVGMPIHGSAQVASTKRQFAGAISGNSFGFTYKGAP